MFYMIIITLLHFFNVAHYMNGCDTDRDTLTKLHQGVYGPYPTKQSRQLVLFNITEPFINGIRKELIYTQQSAEKISRF